MKKTKNLKIPLLQYYDLVNKEGINAALERIDEAVVDANHAGNNSHWKLWKKNTAYKKNDVFRTSVIPSWGFWEVTTGGTSGTIEPSGATEDEIVQDGTCEITLRRLTKSIQTEKWELWEKFVSGKNYYLGDLFRAKDIPSWGYFIVTKAGKSSTEPSATVEGTIVQSGTMECVLCNIDNVRIQPWIDNTSYRKGVIILYDRLAYRCIKAHTSSNKFEDDNNNWEIINYDKFRLWDTFKENYAYSVGDVFKTSDCPSWGFWVITKAGISSTTKPAYTKDGAIEDIGTAKCQLSRVLNSSDVCTKKKALSYALIF